MPDSPPLTIRFHRSADKYSATVDYEPLALSRSVQADVCGDAAMALSLITAIAFDPRADTSPGPLSETGSGEPAGAATPTSQAQQLAPADAAPLAPTRSETLTSARADVGTGEPSGAQDSLTWHVGVGPALRIGDHQDIGWGAALIADAWGSSAVRGLSLGLGFYTSDTEHSLGSVNLTQLLAAAAWCPRLTHGSPVRFSSCVGAEAGAMVANAGETAVLDASPARWRPQAAPYVALDLRATVAPSWDAFGRLSLLMPLIRDTFTVERLDGSSESAFTVRRWAASLAAGVSHDL